MAIGFAKFGEKQPDQAFLADVVKSVHARLREDYKKGEQFVIQCAESHEERFPL